MKNIVKIKVYTLAMALFAGTIFNACERRELENIYIDTALIPVRIDWSLSGVPVEGMHRASIWFFPEDGGQPMVFPMQTNLTYREITVPAGVYSALVFNETIEDSDWDGIVFTGTDSYKTFAAMSVPKQTRGFYTRSDTLPLINEPEALAAWSLDRFEVTPEMVTRTRSLAKNKPALEKEAPYLIGIKPLPRFERVVITAYVTNLSSSKQVTGTIDGMAAGVYMVSGEKIPQSAAHAFILNRRKYEANGNDGTTTRAFNIFGRLPEQAKHNIAIDFLLANDSLLSAEFDATNLIVADTEAIPPTHIIDLGYGNLTDNHPITLPELSMSSGISIDDWDEVIIPIK